MSIGFEVESEGTEDEAALDEPASDEVETADAGASLA
jgi:hypothetical protein